MENWGAGRFLDLRDGGYTSGGEPPGGHVLRGVSRDARPGAWPQKGPRYRITGPVSGPLEKMVCVTGENGCSSLGIDATRMPTEERTKAMSYMLNLIKGYHPESTGGGQRSRA